MLRAIEKEFSHCANYAKGHGDQFYHWMGYHHPGAQLWPAERASGSRQDLACSGAGPLYSNREYYVEFLDECLHESSNILQENLFIILSSTEMTAYARVCSIVHLAISIPTRWLAGKTHELKGDDWLVRSMGLMVDSLEDALMQIQEDPKLFLDENFMMGIFSDIEDKVPQLKEHLLYLFEEKQTDTIVGESQSLPYDRLRADFFS